MKKNPYFTISIPSLNRLEFLKLTIKSVLEQTFTDYEILIIDDHSDEDIKKYINSLKSPKIKFVKNKKRMGFKYTYIKCLLDAKGKYVLTMGNDDIFCDKDTLLNVYNKLENKENVGLAKISPVYFYKQIDKPCFSPKLEKKDIYIPRNGYIKFFKAIDDYSLTHIAGNIYLRELINNRDVLDNDLIPFFKILVNCAVKKGFLLISDEYVAVAMSISYLPMFFEKEIKKESWFYVNYRMYKSYISEAKSKQLVIQKMKERFPFFISHKSYMGNKALRFLIKEYISFDKSFKYNLKMYIYFIISLFIPRKLFFIIRDTRYKTLVNNFSAPRKYFNVLSLIDNE